MTLFQGFLKYELIGLNYGKKWLVSFRYQCQLPNYIRLIAKHGIQNMGSRPLI